MKALIIYYSWKGHTKTAADTLKKAGGFESRRIEEVHIRRGLISFIKPVIQALVNYRSDLRPYNQNIEGFDKIFLGTPVWAGNPAPAVNAFLKEADLKNKRFVLFFTYSLAKPVNAFKKMERMIKRKGGKVEGPVFIKNQKGRRSRPEEIIKNAFKKYL